PAFLAMRYCTPKFMDLEAGEDWKARLWNSMQKARCVFIDVADLTVFVAEEIKLACECLGLERVLFIGDNSCDEVAWKSLIAAHLASGLDPDKSRVAVWSGLAGNRQSFMDSIRSFGSAVPEPHPKRYRHPPLWCGSAVENTRPLGGKAGDFLVAFMAVQIA